MHQKQDQQDYPADLVFGALVVTGDCVPVGGFVLDGGLFFSFGAPLTITLQCTVMPF